MAFKNSTDFRRSLEARLYAQAAKEKVDLQGLRRKVAFDRFLARIFAHGKASFFLKGGYAIELYFSNSRTTKDIDLVYLLKDQSGEKRYFEDHIFKALQSHAEMNLGDFFQFEIIKGKSLINVPYGGARYAVKCNVDKRLFVKFHIDVGADVFLKKVNRIKSPDWLSFIGIPSSNISIISIEQQFAEKIHAYTLPRERLNSRAKDLIDLNLIINHASFDQEFMLDATKRVFKSRNSHPLPNQLENPPKEWENLFNRLSSECNLNRTLDVAFEALNSFFLNLLQSEPGETILK